MIGALIMQGNVPMPSLLGSTTSSVLRRPILGLAGALIILLPASASAATMLSAEAIVGPLNEDGVRNEDVSTNATTDSVVSASASGSGTFFGATVEAHEASASIDYRSGALKARAEAISFSDAVGGGGSAVGTARLFDEITFDVSPSATSRDVTFLWQIDRIIVGEQGSVSGFFQVRDGVSSFGNTLINDQLLGIDAFSDSGTYSNRATITLPDFPSSEAPLLRIEYLLRSQASIYSVLVDGGTASDTRGSLADAGNTAFLNIITPEGVTFQGGGEGFLSTAPDLQTVAPIPIPATGLLLAAALGCVGVFQRRRS